MNHKTAKIFGFIFPIILVSVMLLNIFLPDKKFSAEENRMLQMMPKLSFTSYIDGRFESKIESYAADQFLLRNHFIKIKSSFDSALLISKSNNVFNCSDNYLMEDISKVNKKKMRNNIDSLSNFKKCYPDIQMDFMLVPNAANILSDKLPLFAVTENQNKQIDDFFQTLKSLEIEPIDVRSEFEKQKAKTELYYHTDHHWTTDGAYLAYGEFHKKKKFTSNIQYEPLVVKNDFRGTLSSKSGFTNGLNDKIKIFLPKPGQDYKNSVIFYSDSKKKTTEFYQLDNLNKKDTYTVFGGSNHPIYSIKTPVASQKRLLLIKDSYANSFIPFISQDYREIVVVDPRYFFDDIGEIIKAHKITDVLFLYNANTFFNDNSLEMMLSASKDINNISQN
ncbi:MAG: DHHW family protein [Eubacterium sp.]|nr:DHHW family protein [Eubacterium sp.]